MWVIDGSALCRSCLQPLKRLEDKQGLVDAHCVNVSCDMRGYLLADLSEATYARVRSKMERHRARRRNHTLSAICESNDQHTAETGNRVDLTHFFAYRPAKVKLISYLHKNVPGLKAAELRGWGVWVDNLTLDFADTDAALGQRGYVLVSTDLAQREQDRFVRTRTVAGYVNMPKKIEHVYEQRGLVALPNITSCTVNMGKDCPQEKAIPMKQRNYEQLMLNLRQGGVGNVRFQLSPVTLADFAYATVAVPWEALRPGDKFIYERTVAVYLGREVIEVHDPLRGISHELATHLRGNYLCALPACEDWQLSTEQRATICRVLKLEREEDLHEFDAPRGASVVLDYHTGTYRVGE